MLMSEAHAVNQVIDHLTGTRKTGGEPIVSREQTIDALVLLTRGAYKALKAGYTPADSGQYSARAALDAHWPGALREVWMLEMHGVDGEPFASEQAARRHAAAQGGWHEHDDLAWRTGLADSETGRAAKVLYANGHRTLCTLWPAPLRGLDPGADGTEGARLDAPDESVATCQVCGCTEDDPCDGGCAWATGNSLEIDLCTACAFAIARDAIASGLYKPTLIDAPTFACYGLAVPRSENLPWSRLVAFQDFCAAVWGECDRQWAKWGDQRHPDGTGGELSASIRDEARKLTQRNAAEGPVTWDNILSEEIFEAFAETELTPLRTELIQSAAVIATWIADMDRRAATGPTTTPVDERAPTPSQLVWDLARQWTRGHGADSDGLAPHVIRIYDAPELFDPDQTGRFVEIGHPAECRKLPPGAKCWIDTDPHRGWWPDQTGIYRIHPEDCVNGGDEDGPNIVPGWVCERYDETSHVWAPYEDESEPSSGSSTGNEAYSDADRPLGELDTA